MNININLPAVIVAAVAAFAVGGIWYTVFGKAWMDALGKTREDLQGNATPAYIVSAAGTLLAAVVLALLIVNLPPGGPVEGAVLGVAAAVAFVATAMLDDALFAGRRLKLWIIIAGHRVVALGIAGAILGVWR